MRSTRWLATVSVVVIAACSPSPPAGQTAYNDAIHAIARCVEANGLETDIRYDPVIQADFLEIIVDENELLDRADEVDRVWDLCSARHEGTMETYIEGLDL